MTRHELEELANELAYLLNEQDRLRDRFSEAQKMMDELKESFRTRTNKV